MRKRVYIVYPRWRWQTGGLLFLVAILVVVMLLKLQVLIYHDPVNSFASSEIQKPKEATPKIAFLFLARHRLSLDFLWEHFFQESQVHEYSVHIHARPGYVYTSDNTKCRSFINRQLPESVLVGWGEASMIQAERLLLTEALKDPLNHRFILVSDSCIPLYNFRYVYDYVLYSQKSFVDSFVDLGDTRYNPKMAPVIRKEKWRKGSQWFVLVRKHAVAIVEDSAVFHVFQKHCQRLALPEFWEYAQLTLVLSNLQNHTKDVHNCIPDEHYLQTLLAMKDLESEFERRTLTYSQWPNFKKVKDRRSWHPITFDYAKATLRAIKDIQDIYRIHYATESRMEWCSINGEVRSCYLFARKFTRGAGIRLLEQAAAYENRLLAHRLLLQA